MRDIKFRAWDSRENVKVMWYEDELCTHMDIWNIGHMDGNTIMQFTGLRDKNGKDVYDGDIIKIIATISGDYDTTKVESVKQVIWRDCFASYCLETKQQREHFENETSNVYKYCRSENRTDVYFLDQLARYEMEVIGNIYENPDLLPQERETA